LPFDLDIVTPHGRAFQGAVDGVQLPGSEGEFGVLPGHERFLTALRIGEVAIRRGAQTVHAAISDGIAEVRGDAVKVLVETCELADAIDVARAEQARSRAADAIADLPEPAYPARLAELEAALARAKNRLTVASRKA
jgi:F-type H+-transporting ATPase subunit epsilon